RTRAPPLEGGLAERARLRRPQRRLPRRLGAPRGALAPLVAPRGTARRIDARAARRERARPADPRARADVRDLRLADEPRADLLLDLVRPLAERGRLPRAHRRRRDRDRDRPPRRLRGGGPRAHPRARDGDARRALRVCVPRVHALPDPVDRRPPARSAVAPAAHHGRLGARGPGADRLPLRAPLRRAALARAQAPARAPRDRRRARPRRALARALLARA